MGDEKENTGLIPENAAMINAYEDKAYDRKSAEQRRRIFLMEKSRIITELSYERRELCQSINNLTGAIIENPEEVSSEQKTLWRLQHEAMLAYKNVLDKRIVNLIKESENDYRLDKEPEKV